MPSDRPARPSKAGYRLDIALAVAARSTCLRRRYGAVAVANDEIAATGCNGAARGDADCIDTGICHRCGHGHDDGDQGPCPVCMRMIGDAGVDVVTSA